MKTLVVLPQEQNDYGHQLLLAKNDLNDEVIFTSIDNFNFDLIEKEEISVVISSGFKKEWFYLLRKLGVVLITFGERKYYSELSDIIIDYKDESSEYYFTGKNVDFTSEPSISIADIAILIKKLDWDTNFFGFNIAYLSCLHLTENITKKISLFIKKNDIKLVEYLCNCHDRNSVEIAEKNGFSFVDIRLTFIKNIVDVQPEELRDGLTFRQATIEDISDLEKIADGIYTKSRYFFDKKFDADKVIEFYLSWVRKAVYGDFDDECWLLAENNQPIAFCTLRYVKNEAVQIGLFGMSNAHQGNGLAKILLQSVFEMLQKKNILWVTVVTQGRNYPAQNLYQSAGFKTKETQLWYHKWR